MNKICNPTKLDDGLAESPTVMVGETKNKQQQKQLGFRQDQKFFLLKFERFMIGTLNLYLRRAATVLRQIKMEEEEQNMKSEKLLNRHEIQHKYVRI